MKKTVSKNAERHMRQIQGTKFYESAHIFVLKYISREDIKKLYCAS